MKRQWHAAIDRGARMIAAVTSQFSHPEFKHRVKVRMILAHEQDRQVWLTLTPDEAETLAAELFNAAAHARAETSTR